jgi:two-component system nitrate/nitrite response regulator NarL
MTRRIAATADILTPRERDIVRLVAKGRSNAQIARALSLRPQTVKNRLSVVFEKTGVTSRLELALLALRDDAD